MHDELQIGLSVLYRWRDAYRKEGAAGLRPAGEVPLLPRPSEQRIVGLERKIGQQALDMGSLTRAFKRAKESCQKNTGTGRTASTEKSEACCSGKTSLKLPCGDVGAVVDRHPRMRCQVRAAARRACRTHDTEPSESA